MKCAIYARVSTKDKQEIGLQLDKLRDFAKAREYKVVKEYKDIGESGAKTSRPQFNQMMMDARKRKFKVLLIYKLDRLSRSLKHLITTVEKLQDNKVDIVTLEQDIDTTTSSGKLQFNMIGAFSEFERDLISERVKDGMARAKSKGKKLGRPFIDVDTQKVCDLYDLGMSGRDIAKEVGVSKSTVYNILSKNGIRNHNDYQDKGAVKK